MLERWKPIVPHLRDFETHLCSDFPPLQIQAANERSWSQQRYLDQRKTGIFNGYGVYLLFAEDQTLLYVGLAMNRFDDRIWSHDHHVERHWTDVVAIGHEHYFLAPALEFFLISRLHPPRNRTYRGYTIVDSTKP